MNGRTRRYPAWLAAALLAGAAPAAAQDETLPIRPGDALAGRIEQGDPDGLGRGRLRAYHADLRAGQRLIAGAVSADFDAYLTVGRLAGPVFDPLRSDDDGGGGTDARLRFTVPRDGRYLFVVQSYDAEGTGAFTLTLAAAPEATTGAAVSLAVGARAEGVLAETDRMEDERGRYYDVYTFRGRAGQRISATMESRELDAYLVLGRMEDGRMVRIATDDDGGPRTDARLRRTLGADGDYVLHATSFEGGATGRYTVALEERADPALARRPLAAGERTASDLDGDDPTLDADGSHYEEWTFSGRAGERVRVRMRSRDFDTYLSVGRDEGGELRELASNDDGGEGTDSEVELTLPADGDYVVRANSYSAGETGAYTIQLDRLR